MFHVETCLKIPNLHTEINSQPEKIEFFSQSNPETLGINPENFHCFFDAKMTSSQQIYYITFYRAVSIKKISCYKDNISIL